MSFQGLKAGEERGVENIFPEDVGGCRMRRRARVGCLDVRGLILEGEARENLEEVQERGHDVRVGACNKRRDVLGSKREVT